VSRPPVEFDLAVACCRRAFAKEDAEQDIHQLAAGVDWGRFVRCVRFHRIEGLAWNALWSAEVVVPKNVAQALSADAEAIVAANLQIAVEMEALRSDFAKARVDLLFLKGLTVAALVYPRPLLKRAWDIDLLVDPGQLVQSVEILSARGYRLVLPGRLAGIQSWHVRHKESVWTRRPGLHVELHSWLADNRRLIPSIDLKSPRQLVQVSPGILLPTLAEDELFAYLCVHGASSLWFRLKWITDFAGLVASRAPAEVERLYDRSQQLGSGRAAGQALLLADMLFGSLADTDLEPRLRRDRAARWLAAAAYRQLAGNREYREPTEVPFGTAAIHLAQLPLLPGPRFAISEVARQIRNIAGRQGGG
jgi:hypothetical protein